MKILLGLLIFLTTVTPAFAQELADRGTGVATSMFGTYIREKELIVYRFYEYYRDKDFEYAPEEFGVPGSQDFRGRYRAHEALFFVAYGLRENVANSKPR